MARLAVLLAIAILGYLLWQTLRNSPPERRRQLLLRGGLYGLVAVIFLLAVTGRVHWIMAAGAAMIPFVKVLFGLLLRAFPLLQVWLKHRNYTDRNYTDRNNTDRSNTNQDTTSPQSNTDVTESEAWQLLGLEPGASREDIMLAHKRLIQKLHPDRGGNDYLAAKLNAARDLLLGKSH